MKLVRVVAPHFVAGFETDGIVRRTAPILKQMRGWDDTRARRYMVRKGWKASVIPDQLSLHLIPASSGAQPGEPAQVAP